MNGKISGNRGPRRARATAVTAAIAVLVTGCGAVHVHFGSAPSSPPAAYGADLAYAHCMRANGLPDFPLPSPSGTSSFDTQPTASPGSPTARANDACRHILPGG